MTGYTYTLKPLHRNVNDQFLFDDLVDCRDRAGGVSLTMAQYESMGKFSPSTFIKRFGSWNRSLTLAGIPIGKKYAVTDDDLFENLARIWNETGSQPRYDDLRNRSVNSKYGAKTYANRFGSWRSALEAFVHWANDGSIFVHPEQKVQAPTQRTPRTINWRMRALVLMRDSARCQLCGATPLDGVRLHVDHIHPWSKGGETTVENLRILCEQCNVGKSDLVPAQGENT